MSVDLGLSSSAHLDAKINDCVQDLIKSAREAHIMCATAESCTGGLVASAITAAPGASDIFAGSVVSYILPVKEKVLKVDPHILYTPEIGAVSQECASQMASGVKKLLSADCAVSVTGIAGPSGSEPQKPVGTVWFGLAYKDSVQTELCHFSGDRNRVRKRATLSALQLLCKAVAYLQQDCR